MRKQALYDKLLSHTIFDRIFPLHIRIGMRQNQKQNPEEQVLYDLTPFKSFHLKRTYLVWANSKKFDHLYTDEEKQLLLECEDT